MNVFLYVVGSLFGLTAFFSKTPLVLGAVAVYYMSNPVASALLYKHFSSFTWYVYFTSVNFLMAMYLVNQDDAVLRLAAYVCVAAAILTFCSSKYAIAGGWFDKTYDQWFGVSHGLLIFTLGVYAFQSLK